MTNDKSNMDELTKDKLILEIQELKDKLADSKKGRIWENYIKPVVPVIVTILITIFGWTITGKYNKSQLKIVETKNKSDKEIAQINASLSFIKLMNEIPDSSIQLRQQAKTVISPALPPEIGFYIAMEDLTNNPFLLEVLIRTYPKDYWIYLKPYLERYPLFFKDDPFRVPVKDLTLISFLDKRQLLDSLFYFICSDSYNSPNRIFALINYLDYFYAKEELDHNPAKNEELKYKFFSIIESSSALKLKSDISNATSIVLDKYQSNYFYTEMAAKYFWESLDLSIGETFKNESIEQYIYANRFHRIDRYNNKYELPAVDSLSKSLLLKLFKLNYKELDVDRINVILYSYCESINNDSKTPFSSYLKPKQSFQLIQKIITSLNTEQKKQKFSMHLGSMSGDVLFRNISQDKEVGKQYSELIINWYHQNWRKDWYIPKFIHSVIHEYPEFKLKIDKKWGVGIE